MQYDCDLLLRQNGNEKRMPHRFIAEIEPGRFLRLEGRDWIVTEIHEGDKPLVICRPPGESYLGTKRNGQSEGLTVSGE
jgi:hypothetical protein